LGDATMKAVILAAGEGTRLRPFTNSKPKVMIEVANRPIIGYIVDALVANGIRDIIIVVGYHKEQIMSHFDDGSRYGARIEYAEESKQLGTAHALATARGYIDSDFMVLPGDNIIDPLLIQDLLEGGGENSLAMTESDIPSKYGVVHLKGEYVQEVIEKPEKQVGNLISTGIYTFSKSVLDDIVGATHSGTYAMSSVANRLIEDGLQLKGVLTGGRWMDAVYPWDLLEVNSAAMDTMKVGLAGKIEAGVEVRGEVSVGEGSVIRAGSYVVGPAIIGAGCEIGPNVVITPSTTIGENVRICPFTTLEHCVVESDVTIGPGCHISSSVIGSGVTLGSNFSVSKGKAVLDRSGEYHRLSGVGAMIGEDTEIGNSVFAKPGTIVGADCKVGSLVKLEGVIKDGSTVV